MASLKDVQNQIVSIKKTKQITKAMNMVASAKLRGAQDRIERFRPYADKFYEMLGDLAAGADSSVHPLLEVHEEIKTVGIVLTTSDRGLCGSFNANMINAALKLAAAKMAEGKAVKFYCVGKKGAAAVKKTEYEIIEAYTDDMSSFDFNLAASIGNKVIDAYLAEELDEVFLVFGKFVNVASQPPETLQILPLSSDAAGEEVESGASSEYIYEPSVEGLLAELLPRFVKVQVYRGLLDTSCSEHAARMAAMDNASRACDDMTETLTLLYNKTRQAAITADLMDIVGGAEALKG
ncbi:F0F1 ATP synthase subunit gamma [Maridesulfovibrio sp.]|uniref:F0F1 ATP synthase subunit gamma n=1 Tax=Maridesulfovibrio sp. TaxID=2795000 RepID=UPI0029C9FA1B|nr:F0F1 ATP synthase subunit gamma [Maridesulfovibrio sp.]